MENLNSNKSENLKITKTNNKLRFNKLRFKDWVIIGISILFLGVYTSALGMELYFLGVSFYQLIISLSLSIFFKLKLDSTHLIAVICASTIISHIIVSLLYLLILMNDLGFR